MTVQGIDGNLLDSQAQVILHQVNCQGAMNSGVAKAIREKWSIVFDKYANACKDNIMKGYPTSNLMGKILPVEVEPGRFVVNAFAQDHYGYDGKRYASYDSLMSCLEKTAKYCTDKGLTNVALPFHMSSDRGGANWDVVWAMVKAAFKDTNVNLEVWRLNPEKNES